MSSGNFDIQSDWRANAGGDTESIIKRKRENRIVIYSGKVELAALENAPKTGAWHPGLRG